MLRLILASFMTLTTLLILGCFNNSDTTPSDRSQVVGKLKLYTFSPDHKYFLGYAQPFILPPNTSISDTVDNLGQYLAENYFFKTYTSKLTRIHFEVLSIDVISTPARPGRRVVRIRRAQFPRDPGRQERRSTGPSSMVGEEPRRRRCRPHRT